MDRCLPYPSVFSFLSFFAGLLLICLCEPDFWGSRSRVPSCLPSALPPTLPTTRQEGRQVCRAPQATKTQQKSTTKHRHRKIPMQMQWAPQKVRGKCSQPVRFRTSSLSNDDATKVLHEWLQDLSRLSQHKHIHLHMLRPTCAQRRRDARKQTRYVQYSNSQARRCNPDPESHAPFCKARFTDCSSASNCMKFRPSERIRKVPLSAMNGLDVCKLSCR